MKGEYDLAVEIHTQEKQLCKKLKDQSGVAVAQRNVSFGCFLSTEKL